MDGFSSFLLETISAFMADGVVDEEGPRDWDWIQSHSDLLPTTVDGGGLV